MTKDYVLLSDLAQEWQVDRSNARKYALAAGFSFLRVRTPSSRGQLTLALSPEDAEELRAVREEDGFLAPKPVLGAEGEFYVVQVVPELDLHRIKLGFARDAKARLRSHRTVAPHAKILASWPCRRTWELTVIDYATQNGCEQLNDEVYTVGDVELLISRCRQFFELMPKP